MKLKIIRDLVSHLRTVASLMMLGIGTAQAADLPVGYTLLEYIESTGSQLVNTEWKASATLRCELDFAPLQTSGDIMIGTAKEGYFKYPYRFFNYSAGYIFDIGNGTAGPIRVGQNAAMKLATDGTRYLLKFGIDDNGNAYADATNVGTGDVYAPTPMAASNAAPESEDVYVFGGYVAGRLVYEKMRLYGLKMYDIKDGDAAHSLARDFVPCRNEDGVAGLWDKVEGRFYTNCVEGGLRFVGPDELPGRIEYIESTGSQLLNTTWKASGTLRCELDFAPLMQTGNLMFGTAKEDHGKYPYRFFNYKDGYIFDIGTGSSYVRIGYDTSKKLATDGTRYLLKIGVDDSGKAYADATNVGTGALLSPERKAVSNAAPEANDIYVFGGYCRNSNNTGSVLTYENMRMYGLKMYDFKEGDAERSLVRDFVPYRFANGTFGAYDLANDTPYTGTGVFVGSAPYAYDFEGDDDSTLVAHEGIVPAGLFADRSLIAKASPYEADFSAVTSYPALDLRKGTLSVQDDEATAYTVSGTMKVAGGTHLKIDLTADGCDCFKAAMLDLSALSAASPLFVDIVKAVDLEELEQEYVIAEGAGVADGPLTAVVARGVVKAGFEMRNGRLVMIPISDIPLRAIWKGGATGGLTNVANWTCYNAFGDVLEDGLPTNRTKVVFPDGCAFDWPKGMTFAHGEIVLPASIGGNCDWTGVDMPIDTTVDLKGHKLYVSELKGTGTITDTTALGENLIHDGSFETTTITGNSGTWGYLEDNASVNDYWKTTAGDRAGFTKVGTPWVASGKMIEGDVSALIQKNGDLYQDVQIPEDGSYVLTYSYACRTGASGSVAGSHPLRIVVDDGSATLGRTDSAAAAAVNKVVLHLTAGPHKIAFVGDTTADQTTILDEVSLRKIPAAGELHVVVPQGETTEWTSVAIDGALKFVKEGAGTYLASNMNGTGVKTWYLGDTWVREGCYRVHQSSSSTGSGCKEYDFYDVQQLGAQGSETTVEKGATFDGGGNYDGYCYTIVLNGGTYGNLSAFNQNKTYGTPSRFRLTDDSFVAGLSNTQLGDTDLGGHTLTVTIDPACSLYLCGALTNGTLVCQVGRFWPCGGNWDMADVDLVLDSKMSCADQTVTFRNLKMTYTGDDFGHGDKFFCVRGTYTPVSDQIHRFKLLDGATIDLSERTTPLNIQPHANGLFFDENAETIRVSTAGRKLRSSEPLLTWTTKPNVKFVAAKGSSCGVIAKDDGLYPLTGMIIIFR